jgi:hypothetical protein
VNGTAEVWRERIAAQRTSGRSIRGWCRDNDLHEHAFYTWRSRLGLSPRPSARRHSGQRPATGLSKELEFAEAVVVDPIPARHSESISLRLGAGRELLLPMSMPVDSIAKLIHAIEGKSPTLEAPQ